MEKEKEFLLIYNWIDHEKENRKSLIFFDSSQEAFMYANKTLSEDDYKTIRVYKLTEIK